ncbi:TniQ family protein [Streptomyces sp. MMS21 TC-5]|uniref:TniQ family protein n=1 Tax=Streptomyces sp. MMS21 TC-5 TaxID=2925833 RepID=UPI001F603281|nr:TniQ family protein [Streptomyces sp. MMS21 TC-5]MCI4078868.1 TniQ family protein [Streptomyces sp. MMS21 TC-5]
MAARKSTARRKAWRTPERLPRQARLIADESTGSFLGRLAQLNYMPLDDLMGLVGEGGKAMQPRYTEVYLNPGALERLAALTARGPEVLQRALPSLAPHRLLEAGPEPVWRWPQWEAKDVFLVRACDLCAAARRHPSDVYLVSVTRWRVCPRHHRWLDNLREDGAAWLPLRTVPELVRAHRERMGMERRLGAGGRALLADALHITAFWWNIPSLCPPTWEARRQLLGGEVGGDLRLAPLVSYPETVRIAWMLAARERRRMRGTWGIEDDKMWLDAVGELLDEWRMPVALALVPVNIWMQHHGMPPHRKTTGRPAQGRWRRLPAPLPHEDASCGMHLERLTCLPWRFGDEPPEADDTMAWSVSGRA